MQLAPLVYDTRNFIVSGEQLFIRFYTVSLEFWTQMFSRNDGIEETTSLITCTINVPPVSLETCTISFVCPAV